jgi:hypothetical protein
MRNPSAATGSDNPGIVSQHPISDQLIEYVALYSGKKGKVVPVLN